MYEVYASVTARKIMMLYQVYSSFLTAGWKSNYSYCNNVYTTTLAERVDRSDQVPVHIVTMVCIYRSSVV